MSDCYREWGRTEAGPPCNGCWGEILSHLLTQQGPILPKPDFCQDAAYIAWILDERLRMANALTRIAKGGT